MSNLGQELIEGLNEILEYEKGNKKLKTSKNIKSFKRQSEKY